jgi:hypothetical protein
LQLTFRFIAIDEGQITSLIVAPKVLRERLQPTQEYFTSTKGDLEGVYIILGDSTGKLHVFENNAAGSNTSSAGSSIHVGAHSRTASAGLPQNRTPRVGRPSLKKSMSLQIDRKGVSTTQKLQRSPPPAIRRRGSFSKTLDGDDGVGKEGVGVTHYQPRTVVSERVNRERIASEPIPSSK